MFPLRPNKFAPDDEDALLDFRATAATGSEAAKECVNSLLNKVPIKTTCLSFEENPRRHFRRSFQKNDSQPEERNQEGLK